MTEPYDSEGPRWVVEQAEAELSVRYGALDKGERGLTACMFDPPAGSFLVARARGEVNPIGGVGIRRVATSEGEVRRLWVDQAWRGQGVGRVLMSGLESAARQHGVSALRLSTGDRQPEAVSLYESMGWQRVYTAPDGTALNARHLRFIKSLV